MSKGTVNKAVLLGRLGQDPELKYTANSKTVVNFNLATNESWKGQDGNVQEITDWHRIVIWGKQAEIANTYLKKGSLVYLEGKVRTRSWTDKDNITRYTTEIIADSFQMLGSNNEKKVENQQDSKPVKESDDLPF